MPLIERDLAQAIVKYEKDEFDGITTVPSEKHSTLLRKFSESRIAQEDHSLFTALASALASTGRHETVPIEQHLQVLRTWLYAELIQRHKTKQENADVLEGTDEFNRGHRAAVGS